MHASILALGTAVPKHFFLQEEVADFFIYALKPSVETEQKIKKICQNSAIYKRHSVLADFNKERTSWNFLGENYPTIVPGMTERNRIYKQEAHKLAYEAAQNAIANWGGDPALITHVISVSCTGLVAPGIEFELIRLLKLKNTVKRLGINFMGCFGAFKGLEAAQAFAKENPDHRVLVVCTELCSLHFQADLDSETLVGNSLFADGAAAVIVGTNPHSFESSLREIRKTCSLALENSTDKMSWEVSDRGCLMRLSDRIPVWIGRNIRSFVEKFVDPSILQQECDWPLHPGGKSIIQAIEKAMQLKNHQTQAPWQILANYGNMSSASFLFVLQELFQQTEQKPWSIGLAFGPGLAMEGILLYNPTVKC